MTGRIPMSDTRQASVNQGIAFMLVILLLVSTALAAIALNAPDDDQENDNPWEPVPHYPYVTPLFSGIIAKHLLEAQLEYGYRVPGTEEHRGCRDFIRDTMEEFGYDVAYQEFTYNGANGTNIIARRSVPDIHANDGDQTDAQEGPETLILGAHYDTRPRTDFPAGDEPIMGANDGASGVAVLLELARVLSVRPVNLELEFVFFDIEDSGTLSFEYAQGAKVYAESISEERKQQITGAIVVDMVGDSDLDIYYEKNSDPGMREDIWKEADKLDYNEFHHSEKFNMFDDHRRLINVGIPSVLLIDFEYPYWHTQEDTLDKVSGDSLEKVGRVLERYIYTRTGYQREMAGDQDLTIPPGESLTLEGPGSVPTVHHVNGDVNISGTLVLDNVLFIVNSEGGYEHLLKVHEQGRLQVRDSIITSPQRSLKFEVHGGLSIINSTVEQLWGNTLDTPHPGGIQVYSPDFLIQDSTIRFSGSRGIFIQNVESQHSPAIMGCQIIDNGEVGIYALSSSLDVHDTLVQGNGHGGIRVAGGDLTLTSSMIGYSKAEGSCTTGDCSGPDPTFGVELLYTTGTVSISDTDFSGMEKGIIGSYIDDSGGTLNIENISVDGPDWGIELFHVSALIRHSSFNDTGVGISFQSSDTRIEGNEFNNSISAISSLASTGNISMNVIQGSDISGIYLDRSSVIISNNTITGNTMTGGSEGIRIYRDRGSSIIGNSIQSNHMGVFVRMEDEDDTDDENTSVSLNTIFGNDWGISCLGNSTGLDLQGNIYTVGERNNSHGVFREEREITFQLRNSSSDVYVNISAGNETLYQDIVSEHSHYTRINLPVLIRDSEGGAVVFDTFEAEFTSGSSHKVVEFNIYVISDLTIEFPGTP